MMIADALCEKCVVVEQTGFDIFSPRYTTRLFRTYIVGFPVNIGVF